MISHDLKERFDTFNRLIDGQNWNDNTALFALLKPLKEAYDKFILTLEGETKSAASIAAAVKDAEAKARELVTRTKVRVLFERFGQLSGQLTEFFEHGFYDSGSLLSEIDGFINHYEYCVRNFAEKGLFRLCSYGAGLYSTLGTISQFFTALEGTVYPAVSVDKSEDHKRLSLQICGEYDLTTFAKKISSVDTIYNELGNLCKISLTDNPAQIIKIESGSLWLDILGYPRIIDMLETFFKSAIQFLHRTYTNEGKICSLPKKVEAVDALLDLRNNLNSAGVDTKSLDANLKKASVSLSNNLNTLLSGAPKVVVNQTQYSVGHEQEQRYLEESKRMLLEEPNNQTHENN